METLSVNKQNSSMTNTIFYVISCSEIVTLEAKRMGKPKYYTYPNQLVKPFINRLSERAGDQYINFGTRRPYGPVAHKILRGTCPNGRSTSIGSAEGRAYWLWTVRLHRSPLICWGDLSIWTVCRNWYIGSPVRSDNLFIKGLTN